MVWESLAPAKVSTNGTEGGRLQQSQSYLTEQLVFRFTAIRLLARGIQLTLPLKSYFGHAEDHSKRPPTIDSYLDSVALTTPNYAHLMLTFGPARTISHQSYKKAPVNLP